MHLPLERLLRGFVENEQAGEAGLVQEGGDRARSARQAGGLARLVEMLAELEQDAEAEAVDVIEMGEIEHDARRLGREDRGEGLAHLVGLVEARRAGELDDGSPRGGIDTDLEDLVHGETPI